MEFLSVRGTGTAADWRRGALLGAAAEAARDAVASAAKVMVAKVHSPHVPFFTSLSFRQRTGWRCRFKAAQAGASAIARHAGSGTAVIRKTPVENGAPCAWMLLSIMP